MLWTPLSLLPGHAELDQGSLGQADEGDSAIAIQAELSAHHMERAHLDSSEKDAHISLAGAQILRGVGRVLLQSGRPAPHLAVEDPNRKRQGRSCDFGGRVDQHSVFKQR